MFMSYNYCKEGVTSGAGTSFLYGAPGFIPFFCGVRVAQSLALAFVYYCIDHYLCLCSFSFGHFIVCPSNYHEFDSNTKKASFEAISFVISY